MNYILLSQYARSQGLKRGTTKNRLRCASESLRVWSLSRADFFQPCTQSTKLPHHSPRRNTYQVTAYHGGKWTRPQPIAEILDGHGVQIQPAGNSFSLPASSYMVNVIL